MSTALKERICYVSRSDGRLYPGTDYRFAGDDGGLLDLEFEAAFPRELIAARPPGMWRDREALPVPKDEAIVSFGEGFTPLLPVEVAGTSVLVKQEQLFPSGSYKDRGASVLISHARSIGVERVVEDSSGNAGSAIAAYCARAGIACEIYVPEKTSPGKLAQIRSYGASLRLIPGSREDTAAAVRAEAARDASVSAWYASHSYNPFFFHGTKTFAFEVCEQLGWQAPDALILPAGNGTLLIGAALGFAELRRARVIDSIPAIYAVQAARCAPLARAHAAGLPSVTDASGVWLADAPRPAVRDETVAEGIAIATPVRGNQILEAVRESGGSFITVDEPEIRDAHRAMTRCGFCIEPTSAATIAAVPQVRSRLPGAARVVTLFSGHGLKAPEKLPG